MNAKFIAKSDEKATDKICDKCDFEIANPKLPEWAGEIRIRQRQTKQLFEAEKASYMDQLREQKERERQIKAQIEQKSADFRLMQLKIKGKCDAVEEDIKDLKN